MHAELRWRPRLGFLGLGWIGRQRLQSVVDSDLAEVAAVADLSYKSLTAASELVPKAKKMETLEQLLQEDLDGIVIATPSALHPAQTIQALRARVAVFCQKPLGRHAAEVADVISTARQVDRLLGVDLSYRHLQGLIKIRDLVREESLGEIFAINLVFHNAYGPDKAWFYHRADSGGGCLVDLGVHLVDAALWILGDQVTGVEGRIYHEGLPVDPSKSHVEDYAAGQIFFAKGSVANLACSWRLPVGKDAEIGLGFYGTHGGAALRNLNGSFSDFRAERYRGTCTEVLTDPPDDWAGGAIEHWTKRLATSDAFDPAIERQIDVAQTLDAFYCAALR